ncbi:MAG: methyltransferase domain-containing protein, partial [Sphingomonadaceae bacterium]
TLQLAAAGATVTAVDISAPRLARLRENLERTGLKAQLVEADLEAWTPPAPARAILLDAPCSATGIARRHPDVLHLKASRDLAPLVELQARLLARAAGWLAQGGRLVFATCSLEREEGEAQVERLLANTPGLALDPVRAEELPAGLAPRPQGWVRTLPGDLPGGLDGFFIARLRRAG